MTRSKPPPRCSLVAADNLPLRIDGYVVSSHVLHVTRGVAEGDIDAFHAAVRSLLRAHQQAGDAAARAAVLSVEVDVLVRMVEDQPSAAACTRCAYDFAILRVPLAWPNVCQLLRFFPVSLMSGRKSGPEANASVIPLKTTTPASKQLFFVIALYPHDLGQHYTAPPLPIASNVPFDTVFGIHSVRATFHAKFGTHNTGHQIGGSSRALRVWISVSMVRALRSRCYSMNAHCEFINAN